MSGRSQFQSSFKIDKKRKTPTATVQGRAKSSVSPPKENNVGVHKWAKQPHTSLVFSLGKNNDLNAKRTEVPGTSIIKIVHRKDNYINPRTEQIKYPEMAGTRMFKGPSPASSPQPSSRHSTPPASSSKQTPPPSSNEHVLDIELTQISQAKPGTTSTNSLGSYQNVSFHQSGKEMGAECPGMMNVRPYTNLEPGISSKFSLQKHIDSKPSLPGTSIIFQNNEIVNPLLKGKNLNPTLLGRNASASIRRNDLSSKDWQVFTVHSDATKRNDLR